LLSHIVKLRVRFTQVRVLLKSEDRVSCCFRPMFPPGVIIEQVVEHEGALPNYGVQCSVESIEDQSCLCSCCVVSWNGGHPQKSHTIGILLISTVFLSPMRNKRCAPTSMALNS